MAKLLMLPCKHLKSITCLFFLATTRWRASSARILDDVTPQFPFPINVSNQTVAPTTLPSGKLSATTTGHIPPTELAAPVVGPAASTSNIEPAQTTILVHVATTTSSEAVSSATSMKGSVAPTNASPESPLLVPLNTINGVINNNNFPSLISLNGSPTNTVLQNSGNNNIVNSGNNYAFVTAGQLLGGLTLQQLMFGSVTVVDNKITEWHELRSAVLGKAQGFYMASSSDCSNHMLVLTALFHGHHHKIDDRLVSLEFTE
ncbi:unnamed protein product [Fraxinus pennsylvanica]|uniref:Dirigent protein n=1 Tax=Fraxinus pennsylvanica TaxID=56036 RepID=A0AAD2DLR1_9LAMI|nr:unnamed protein product [Fraxinus pennsylvanica]